jgi:hypothetical protein
MRGQVLEIECDSPDRVLQILREVNDFDEVALYGATIHVVAEGVAGRIGEIEQALVKEGISVRSVAVVAPSLEDAFISTVRSGQTH